MNIPIANRVVIWMALLILSLGCRPAPRGWTPVLEETSTTYFSTQIEKATASIRLARELMRDEPDEAADALDAADHALEELLTYYLPLFEAREHSYNAYRHAFIGQKQEVLRELDLVERRLLAVADQRESLLHEMESPLEALEDARAATKVGSEDAPALLEDLARQLNFMVLRGDLVLTED